MLIGAAMLFALRGPPFVAGRVIGIAASIKPQLLVMAPLIMIVRRVWAMLGGSMVGGLSALAVQLALQGIQPWIEWYQALAAFRQAVIDQNIIMNAITPTALFERHGLDPRPAMGAGIICALAAVVRMSRRVEGIDLAALIVGTGILASPYPLPHDTILLAPACACLRDLLIGQARCEGLSGNGNLRRGARSDRALDHRHLHQRYACGTAGRFRRARLSLILPLALFWSMGRWTLLRNARPSHP